MANTSDSDRFGRLLIVASIGMLLLAICALALFGFVGIGRSNSFFGYDARYLFIAGEAWEQARSPYDMAAFQAAMLERTGIEAGPYAYPPTSFPLAMLMSLGSLSYSDIAIAVVNAASLLLIAGYITIALGAAGTDGACLDRTTRVTYALIAVAFIVGNPFTAHAVWLGQTTLLAAALIVVSWLLAHRRLDVLAGILLGLGAFKPQLAALIGLWFLLDRRWLLLVAAAATTLVISALPMVMTGLQGSWLAWLTSIPEYQNNMYNQVDFRHVFGMQSVLDAVGVRTPSLLPVAAIATIVLYLQRKHYDEIWLVAPILAIMLLFSSAHDYDVALATLMVAPLLVSTRGRLAVRALLVVLVLLLFIPQRLWEYTQLGALSRSRELAVAAMLVTYLFVCRRSRADLGAPAPQSIAA